MLSKGKVLLSTSLTIGLFMFASPIAFASSSNSPNSFTTQTTISPQQTSINLTIPNVNSELQPTPTLTFTFTLSGPLGYGGTNPIQETGTLVNSSTATYQIPLPNYGKPETVWVSTSYSNNGFQYTASVGPLLDALPEVPLAALLPLALVGVWFYNRKRRNRMSL